MMIDKVWVEDYKCLNLISLTMREKLFMNQEPIAAKVRIAGRNIQTLPTMANKFAETAL
ncbi:hypothetical protein N779_05345 [Vibrio coralliilyticus OCN008]|nr:hypothetical protein N779_05345 [Vibrio coralliilyticus OCN008]